MSYGFNEIGEPKIRRHDEPEQAVTGSRKGDEATDTPAEDVTDIDPAEFLDPEEFGIKRREPRILDP